MWKDVLLKVIAALALFVSLMAFYAANPVSASVNATPSDEGSALMFIVSLASIIAIGAVLVYNISKRMK